MPQPRGDAIALLKIGTELTERADLINGAQAPLRTNFARFPGSHLGAIIVSSIMLDIWTVIIYSALRDDGMVR
jgi:hypothetical protein